MPARRARRSSLAALACSHARRALAARFSSASRWNVEILRAPIEEKRLGDNQGSQRAGSSNLSLCEYLYVATMADFRPLLNYIRGLYIWGCDCLLSEPVRNDRAGCASPWPEFNSAFRNTLPYQEVAGVQKGLSTTPQGGGPIRAGRAWDRRRGCSAAALRRRPGRAFPSRRSPACAG